MMDLVMRPDQRPARFQEGDGRFRRLHLQLLKMLQVIGADDEDLGCGLDRRQQRQVAERTLSPVKCSALSPAPAVSCGAQSDRWPEITPDRRPGPVDDAPEDRAVARAACEFQVVLFP
jgi:hypothetical protein